MENLLNNLLLQVSCTDICKCKGEFQNKVSESLEKKANISLLTLLKFCVCFFSIYFSNTLKLGILYIYLFVCR